MADAEVLTEAEAAKMLNRSPAWLRRSKVPVVRLPTERGGKASSRARLYLRSELIAFCRKYLSHSVAETTSHPAAPRRPIPLHPHRRRSA